MNAKMLASPVQIVRRGSLRKSRVVLGGDRVLISIRPEAAVADSSPHARNLFRTDEGSDLAILVRLKHRHGALMVAAAGGEQPAGARSGAHSGGGFSCALICRTARSR
jgi:hypothetical protein